MIENHTVEFLAAGKADAAEIARQREVLLRDGSFGVILDRVPSFVFVLNRQRQAIYANRAAVEAAVIPSLEKVLGRRVGELFGCVHSSEAPAGCGTTRFCSECGAAKATQGGLQGKTCVEECRIVADRGGGEEALDLRVWTSPLAVGEESFVLVVAASIADEKRRDFLERIFLHDIMNSAGALEGMAALVEEEGPGAPCREEYIGDVAALARRVVLELQAHRILVSAESGDLVAAPSPIGTLAPMREVAATWAHPILLGKRRLTIDPASEDLPLVADPALVGRVLGNLVKNAVEASIDGQTVTLGCRSEDGLAAFRVHNESCMPEAVRLQVFQRSFSTKGKGRGLGTYSTRFLVERYLGGAVDFTSTPAEGTTFRVRLPLVPPAAPGSV